MISCTLTVDEDIEEIHRLFAGEKLKSGRAECTISKDRTLKFKVSAKDAVSMRAFLSSILKTVEIYQKTRDIR